MTPTRYVPRTTATSDNLKAFPTLSSATSPPTSNAQSARGYAAVAAAPAAAPVGRYVPPNARPGAAGASKTGSLVAPRSGTHNAALATEPVKKGRFDGYAILLQPPEPASLTSAPSLPPTAGSNVLPSLAGVRHRTRKRDKRNHAKLEPDAFREQFVGLVCRASLKAATSGSRAPPPVATAPAPAPTARKSVEEAPVPKDAGKKDKAGKKKKGPVLNAAKERQLAAREKAKKKADNEAAVPAIVEDAPSVPMEDTAHSSDNELDCLEELPSLVQQVTTLFGKSTPEHILLRDQMTILDKAFELPRYAETLFSVMITGGMLEVSGRVNYGEGLCYPFSLIHAPTLKVFRERVESLQMFLSHYRFFQLPYEDTIKQLVSLSSGWNRIPADSSTLQPTRLWLSKMSCILAHGGSTNTQLLATVLRDHLVKEGVALEFLIGFCRAYLLPNASWTWTSDNLDPCPDLTLPTTDEPTVALTDPLENTSMSTRSAQLYAHLRKAGVADRLSSFFSLPQRTVAHMRRTLRVKCPIPPLFDTYEYWRARALKVLLHSAGVISVADFAKDLPAAVKRLISVPSDDREEALTQVLLFMSDITQSLDETLSAFDLDGSSPHEIPRVPVSELWSTGNALIHLWHCILEVLPEENRELSDVVSHVMAFNDLFARLAKTDDLRMLLLVLIQNLVAHGPDPEEQPDCQRYPYSCMPDSYDDRHDKTSKSGKQAPVGLTWDPTETESPLFEPDMFVQLVTGLLAAGVFSNRTILDWAGQDLAVLPPPETDVDGTTWNSRRSGRSKAILEVIRPLYEDALLEGQ